MAGNFGGYFQPRGAGGGITVVASGSAGPNSITSGVVGSGAVYGQANSGAFTIASGSISTNDISLNAITSGLISSGSVGFGHLANASIQSGTYSSGSLSWAILSSGIARSGHLADASVASGNYSSGSISWAVLSSGTTRSGHIANAAVSSGNLSSGSVAGQHLVNGIQLFGQVEIDTYFGAINTVTDAATITFNLNSGNKQQVTMAASGRVLAISNGQNGQVFTTILIQDATGGRYPTFFSTIKWPSATAPTLTSGGTKTDIFSFLQYNSGQYYGFVVAQAL